MSGCVWGTLCGTGGLSDCLSTHTFHPLKNKAEFLLIWCHSRSCTHQNFSTCFPIFSKFSSSTNSYPLFSVQPSRYPPLSSNSAQSLSILFGNTHFFYFFPSFSLLPSTLLLSILSPYSTYQSRNSFPQHIPLQAVLFTV